MDIAAELQQYLTDAVARHGVPGAAAGVLVDGKTSIAVTGVTSIEHPLPVDSKTLFQVGSITKTFTSAAIMQLVEAGQLALDDPVAKHLPELAETTGLDTDAITIEHLLSHQAGFDGDHLFCHRVPDSLDGLVDAKRLFEPGDGYSYNNAAFSIAGEVIAKLSGQSYVSFVRERLLEPLGMHEACFSADDAITHRVAAPHFTAGGNSVLLRNAGWQPGWGLGPVDLPAGGLVASVEHLLSWCRFQLSGETPNGTRILERSSLDRLHAPVVNGAATFDCGLDWFVRTSGGATTIDHPGETVGYSSILVVAPERGAGVVVLTHSVTGGALNQDVRRWALKRFAGIDERDPEPDPDVAVDISRFEGRYLHPFNVLVVSPGEEEDTLLVTGEKRDDTVWPPFVLQVPTTYRFFTDDHVVSVGANPPSVLRFGFDENGRANWVLSGLRRAPRIE